MPENVISAIKSKTTAENILKENDEISAYVSGMDRTRQMYL